MTEEPTTSPPDRFAGARAVSRSIVEPTAETLDLFERSLRRLGATDAMVETILGPQRERLREFAGPGDEHAVSDVDLPATPAGEQQAVIDTFLASELARVRAERDDLRAEVARLLDDPDCPEGHDLAAVEKIGDVTCCRQCGTWVRVWAKGYDRLPPVPRIVAQLDEARAQRDEARYAAWHLWYRGDDDGISEEDAVRLYPWIGTRTVGPPRPKEQP